MIVGHQAGRTPVGEIGISRTSLVRGEAKERLTEVNLSEWKKYSSKRY